MGWARNNATGQVQWVPDAAPQPVIPVSPQQQQQQQGQIANTGAQTGHTVTETRLINATMPAAISKANTDAQAAQAKLQSDRQSQQNQAMMAYQAQVLAKLKNDYMLQTIAKARGDIGNSSTGMVGGVLGHVPGIFGRTTYARELKQYLDTIKGNVAFQGYEDLKKGLPEGAQGGIRLTGPELDLLQKLQGNLDQTGDPGVLKGSLDNIENQYRTTAITAAGLNPNDPKIRKQFGFGGGAPAKNNAVIDFEHWGK